MNETRRPILVAIGDEHGYEAAVRYAVGRAEREGRPLRMAHVVHPPTGLAGSGGLLISFEAAELVGSGLVHAAEELATSINGTLEVRTVARQGPVATVLAELARDCSVVVLQHRRRSRVTQVLVGSVAADLAARATVPVVSVPEGWEAPETGSPERQRVVVGIGRLDRDEVLIAPAFEAVGALGATVTLLHAWDVPSAYELALLQPDYLTHWDQAGTGRLHELAGPWRLKHADDEVVVRHTRGRPADVLLDATRRADLLVLGRGSGHRPGHHLGSLTRTLLREAECPVEVVPQHEEDA